MSKQNEIKVFKPNSRQADFTVKSVTTEQGVKQLGQELGQEEAGKVRKVFRSLKQLGAESMVFHSQGRKIKVQIAA